MTIVGIVGDVRDGGPREPVLPEMYAPLAQVSDEPWNQWIGRELVLVARPRGAAGDAPGHSTGDATGEASRALALAAALRRAVAGVDARVPLHDVRTTGARLAEALAVEGLIRRLLVALGAVGLALAALGIHGVVLYDVRQRTREMGIRLALGASPRGAVTLLVREGMRPVVAGLVAGAALAAVAARFVEGQLFDVSPLDPASLGGAALLLGAVALASCWTPARRITDVDPALPLRAD